MTVNVTDVSTFTSPIQAIADGDAATQANFLVATQGLSNRTKYLKDILESTGATLLRNGSTATMAALTGMANGSQFLVPGYGLYTYDSGSSATPDAILVFAASGGGRWLHELNTVANTNPGFAVVGTAGATSGRIKASYVPNRVFGATGANDTGTTLTSSDADIAAATVTQTEPGDIALATWTFYANPAARTINQAAVITDDGVTAVTLNSGTISGAGMYHVSYSYAYTVVTGDDIVAKLSMSVDSSTLATWGKANVNLIVIRP